MKALRTALAILLVLVIVGGLGYIGYTYIFMGGMNHGGMNMEMPAETPAPGGTQGQQNAMTPNTAPNTLASNNSNRLGQALTLINQAMDLITIDPYSKATVPNANGMPMQPGQIPAGQGTINIYPGGNSSVTILPDGKAAMNPAPAATMAPNATAYNAVYDQTALRKLHSDIYTVSQGIMMINELNSDLQMQAATAETNPPDYQTYITRYNVALQNKTKLNSATGMLRSLSTLINNNPYAPQSGYQFKAGDMDNLHEGVYKLAQAMVLLDELNRDLTAQMGDAAVGARSLTSGMSMPGMTMTGNTLNLSTIFNIVMVILIIGLIAGVIGAITHMARRNGTPGPAD